MISENKWKEMDAWHEKNAPTTYKVVFTVKEVPEPKPVGNQRLHVTWPCPIYKVGYKMTFNPQTMVLEETDAVCFAVLEGIQPLIRRFKMSPPKTLNNSIKEEWKYFSCPDAERPVIFEVTREQMSAQDKYPSWAPPSKRPNRERYFEEMPTSEEQKAGSRVPVSEKKVGV